MDKFALVPIKPTAEMLEGFDGLRLTRIDEYVAGIIWNDMIMTYIEQSSAPSETLARFSIIVHADGSTNMTIQATDGDPDTLLATAIAALQAEQREVSACPHHSSSEDAPMRTPHMALPGALGQPPKTGTAVKKTAPDAAASEAAVPVGEAHEHLRTIEPVRFIDDHGDPGLLYTAQQVVDAFKAGAAATPKVASDTTYSQTEE